MVINMKHVPDDLYVKPYETVTFNDKDYKTLKFKYSRHEIDNEGVTVYSRDKQIVRIDVCSNQMIRVRILKGKIKESITEKYGLICQPCNKTQWEVRISSENIILKTEKINFQYSLINNEISFTNDKDEKILQTINGGVRFSEEQPDYNSGYKFFTQFEIINKEHFFGFGGRTMPPDRTGSTIDIFNVKVGLEQGDYGGCPVPYFISTNGYGLFLNNPWPHVYFDMGSTFEQEWFLHAPGGDFDIFVFAGKDFSEITEQYTDITGRVPCCEKSIFGFWCSSIGFEEDREVIDSIERLHCEGYPCDVAVVDGPWRGGKDFLRDYTVSGQYPTNDINWHPDFGDGPGMIQELLKMNVKTALHLNSRNFLKETYIPAVMKGLLRQQDEEVVVDFKSQEAIDYYKNLLKPRIEEGVWLWWTDHADRVSGLIDEGVPSRNLFGVLWNKLIAETMEEKDHKKHISLTRGSGIGGQKYGLPWSGDTQFGIDRFEEDIWFCINAGLAGFSISSCDLGGFHCIKKGKSYNIANDPAFDEENICRRVLQSIMFMPVPRIHNHEVSLPKFPWFCPERTRSLYKAVLKYRYELTPYIYSTAIQSSINGGPIVRPLVYHNISDEITYGVNDEFYLGDNIVMAPVVTYGARERLVYLPKGKWINNWTKKEYDGKQFILVPCPLYQITGLPMFIKKGSIIAKQDYALTLLESVPERLTLEIYLDDEGKLELHESDNLTNIFSYKRDKDKVEMVLENNAQIDRTYIVNIIGYTSTEIIALKNSVSRFVLELNEMNP